MLSALLAACASAPSAFPSYSNFASAPSAFPSYSDFAGAAYTVSYDARALTLNDDRAMFVSGAVHPPRGTPETWDSWFALARKNGLNMVQVYVFWNFHEPVEGQIDWSGRANLTDFVRRAASAGLFVNLRIGPYVCAEWTYGGIPAWLGLKPGVAFRQTNKLWQDAMEKWFALVVRRMAEASLFATSGGPIVLVQVENELQPTDKDYVAWCGAMAARALATVGASVPVTMCNGETANSTINTCNGNDCSDFLEKHGQSGRILVDQPALWTENEGGFQVWGGAPPPGQEPYFWGRPIADQALSVMKWFARGGSHMDYYMWAGGSNFGRWTGDAITTMYAADAIVCPDGLPHEPKFAHTSAMHAALAAAAADVMAADAQLDKAHKLGNGAVAFAYGDYAFLEADKSDANVTWRGHAYRVPAQSSTLVRSSTGEALFNSKLGAPSHSATEARRVAPLGALTGWKAWAEPITSAAAYPPAAVVSSSAPVEMTNVTRGLTTFAVYQARLSANTTVSTKLKLPTWQAMAFAAFVDGVAAGAADDHSHSNGRDITLSIDLAAASGAGSTLTLLAEELGYANYGFKTPRQKGLSAAPSVDGAPLAGPWQTRAGLAGEHLQVMTEAGSERVTWGALPSAPTAATWYQARFATPDGDGATELLVNATGLGRGRMWVNGNDVGRYWLLERNDGSECSGGRARCATQELYHVPRSWLAAAGGENVLTLFEAAGAPDPTSVRLAASSMHDGAPPAVDPESVSSCVF